MTQKEKMMRNRYASMPVDQLEAAAWNPNELTAAEFAALVREVAGRGDVLKPVVVRQNGNGRFTIVDGEHTWRAALQVGFRDVPVEVVEVDDFEARRETFVRNRHGRANPVRLGRMWAWMKQARGLTNGQLAGELSVSEGTVRNALLYAEAADRFPERVDEIAQMTVRQVRALLEGDDEQAPAAPAESPRLARMKRDWHHATADERAAFMAFAGLEPVGAARNRYEAAPVQPPTATSEPEDFNADADDEHDPADDVLMVPADLPDAIRERMQERGMTQTEVARRIGLANSSGLSRYLKTGRGLGDASITKACDLLGIEVTAPAGQPVDA